MKILLLIAISLLIIGCNGSKPKPKISDKSCVIHICEECNDINNVVRFELFETKAVFYTNDISSNSGANIDCESLEVEIVNV